MSFKSLLPTSTDVLALSREEVASYILEDLNADAGRNYNGEDAYQQHQTNYLRWFEDNYNNRDVTDKATAAWRWLIERGYLAEIPNPIVSGFYRLTAEGRKIKTHDLLQVPRVPRDMNPGPAPSFEPLTEDGRLRKHLHVLWEEAVSAYNGNAYLSMVIMLGSLLEGAILAKCLENDAAAKAAAHTPKDRSGEVKDYKWWMLNDFIAVADDNQWIHKTRNDFADTLRDYRNMVHPFNAYSRAYYVDKSTADICWAVVKATLGDLGVNI